MKIYNGSDSLNFYDIENCIFYCIEDDAQYFDMPILSNHYILYRIWENNIFSDDLRFSTINKNFLRILRLK